MRHVKWIRLLGVLSVWFSTAHARAHSIELLTQLAFHPTNPNVMALRYINGGNGLLFTSDQGASWQVLCASAIDASDTKGGPIAIAGDGTTLMGLPDGLWYDDRRGCAWSQQADVSEWISDFDRDPVQPLAMYAVTWGSSPALNGMVRRDENGLWTDVGPKEQALINRLRVVKRGAGVRFYESMIRILRNGDAGVTQPNFLVRSSDDYGVSWNEHTVTGASDEVRLQAVDPSNPDRLVVLIGAGNAQDRLLVSADAGATFEQYLTLAQFGGIAFAPDGRVWIGDAGDTNLSMSPQGLWTANSLTESPQKVADFPVRCLGYQPASETLFACQTWSFGQVTLDDYVFASTFEFKRATALLACEGMDMAAVCRAQLCSAWCGPGHFAEAPLCEVYNEPSCGPAVLDMPTVPTTPILSALDAGSSADAAIAPTEGTDQARANDAVADGAAAPSARSRGDDGCSVSPIRAWRPQLVEFGMFTCALSLLGRRRNRIARRHCARR